MKKYEHLIRISAIKHQHCRSVEEFASFKHLMHTSNCEFCLKIVYISLKLSLDALLNLEIYASRKICYDFKKL